MNLPDVIDVLNARGLKPIQTASGWQSRCPAHDDSKPSLTIAEGSGGKVLVNCKAGCTFAAVAGALNLKPSDFFADKPKRNGAHQPARAASPAPSLVPASGDRALANSPANGKGKLVAAYDYRDAAGVTLFQTCRFEPKDFRQRRPDPSAGGGWAWNLKGVRHVIYRLPETLAAVKAGHTIFITEGEKDVAALVKAGCDATCNAGGAGKWREEFGEALRGAAVVILADKDAPGRKHAADVAAKLQPVAASVKVLELPDVNGQSVKDAADFLAAGGTAEQLRELADKATAPTAESGREYDARDPVLQAVREGVAYSQDRRDYWRKTDAGHYVPATEADLKRHLRRQGLDIGTPLSLQFTRFDNAVCFVQDHAAVASAFDLAGHRAGVFVADGGRRVLVPTGANLIAPARGDFSEFDRLHHELFGPEQLDYVLAWQKCALEDYYTLNHEHWRHSQLLCLIGPTGCGKSFWQILFTRLLNSGCAEPWPLLTGGDAGKFTKDLAEAPHWLMSDKPPFRNLSARATFTANVKSHVVSHTLDVHGKGKDKVALPTFRRLTLSVNEDAENLTTIPNLDESMRDKLMLVQCGKAEMLPEQKANLARFIRQRPAWIHFLLHQYRVPPELADVRMGVRAYCHPDIEEKLSDSDPAARLVECMDKVFFADGDTPLERGTCTELQATLCGDPKFGAIARQILPASSVLGQLLAKLAVQDPRRFVKKKVKGQHIWEIHAP